ncbi:MAG: GNAT family N-acetyltransferase [Proteobacteria bacterium]|nr:GNAT family N-acetyltransferase [Pseudomonadota bacterium]
MGITAPEPLTPEHNLDGFDCGKLVLNDWLRQKANKSRVEGGAQTYVVTRKGLVVGYYCISTGSVEHAQLNAKLRRNMPNPIPVILLGRLAVDKNYARQGFGTGLMKDCYLRVLSIAEQAGVRALLVHALDDESRDYYVHLGFSPSPVSPRTLFLGIEEIKANLRRNSEL